MEWMDRWWDPDSALLWNMDGSLDGLAPPRTLHLVPQSAWCALGLLARAREGDLERAARTIEAVVDTQYDEPGAVWHGTYARFREWPRPAEGAVEWEDYDPNWRQFVGTTFTVILRRFADRLPPETRERMDASVRLAVEGEPEGRVPAWYANIALMKAWLDVEWGHVDRGERFAAEVVERFRRSGAFLEYGSPTYYGIDLFALSLWRSWSSSPRLNDWGAEMESALWDDIARWYHADLRNMCGPYSRAYGMDMTSYLGLLGLFIAEAVGADVAPLPDLDRPFEHSHDLTMSPLVALTGADPAPEEVVASLRSFQGERVVEQVVDEELGVVASGWLSQSVMAGGGRGGGFEALGQYHPATIHWRATDGAIGWIRLRHRGAVDAVASAGQLVVTTHDHGQQGATDTYVKSSHTGALTDDRWSFPGLEVKVVGAPPTSSDGVMATAGETTFELHLRHR